MKRTDAIANEPEFQEWRASAFESECQRLQEQTVARDSGVICPVKYDRQSEEPNESTREK
jgi:hypothetical protein